MANKIYIWGNFPEGTKGNSTVTLGGVGKDQLLEFPLLDDVVLEAGTEWTSFTEDLGDVADIVTTIGKISTASGGGDEFTLGVLNIFDAKRWKKTLPFRFSVRIPLYTKTDPKKDVFDVYKALLGYTILYKAGEGDYRLPGINLSNVDKYLAAEKKEKGSGRSLKDTFLEKGRFVSVEIPGVIYLENALIESVRPTISKEVTESRYPLWMSLDITFEGLFPANSGDLDMVDGSRIKSSFASTTIGK